MRMVTLHSVGLEQPLRAAEPTRVLLAGAEGPIQMRNFRQSPELA
jgi:hypothetical protein